MSNYLVLWKESPSYVEPESPVEQYKQLERLVTALQIQVKEGHIKEIREFVQGGSGYALTGDISGDQLHMVLERVGNAIPSYLTFEAYQATTGSVLADLEETLEKARKSTTP